VNRQVQLAFVTAPVTLRRRRLRCDQHPRDHFRLLSPRCAFPSLIDEDRAFLARFGRMITQNNHAFTLPSTTTGAPNRCGASEQTIHSAAYMPTGLARLKVVAPELYLAAGLLEPTSPAARLAETHRQV
jgi:hypothetical protein